MGPCGHGSDEPAGPCQCCAWLDVSRPARAASGLTVVRGWAVPDHVHPSGEGKGAGVRCGPRGLCLPVSLSFSPEASITLSAFPLEAGMPHEVCLSSVLLRGEPRAQGNGREAQTEL